MVETNEIINNTQDNKLKLLPIETKKTIKKKRCFHCKKKSLYVTLCKCGQSFCLSHNKPEIHNCSFNHKLNKIMLEPIMCQKVETI